MKAISFIKEILHSYIIITIFLQVQEVVEVVLPPSCTRSSACTVGRLVGLGSVHDQQAKAVHHFLNENEESYKKESSINLGINQSDRMTCFGFRF